MVVIMQCDPADTWMSGNSIGRNQYDARCLVPGYGRAVDQWKIYPLNGSGHKDHIRRNAA
jgi:hypothetical protein